MIWTDPCRHDLNGDLLSKFVAHSSCQFGKIVIRVVLVVEPEPLRISVQECGDVSCKYLRNTDWVPA